jgi:hypothetical protein
MAIYYTDYVNGDDTTGSGDFTNPFKTIWQASQAISANNDEIRVKGQTAVSLPGTLTFAYNDQFVSTSQDLTSFFPNGSGYIKITNPSGPDVYANVFSVTSTQLDMTFYQKFPLQSGTYSVEAIPSTYFPGVGVTPISPSGTSGYHDQVNTNVINYDGIKITGGWDTETTQDGYTVFETRGTNYYNRYGTSALSIAGIQRGEQLEIHNFHVVNCNGWIKDSSTSHATGDMYFANTPNVWGNSNFGIHAPNGFTPYWFAHYSRIGALTYNGAGGALTPTPTRNLKLDCTIFSNSTNYLFWPNQYQALLKQPIDNVFTSIGDLYWDYVGSSSRTFGDSAYTTKIDNFYFTNGGNSSRDWVINASEYNTFVKNYDDLSTSGDDRLIIKGNSTSSYLQNGTEVMGDGTQDKFKWINSRNVGYFTGYDDAQNVFNIASKPAIINSNEGIWYSYTHVYNNIAVRPNTTDFVTGSNALEIAYNTGSTNKKIMVANFPKWPAAEGFKTLTLKVKNVSGTGSYQVAYIYGSIVNDGITLGTLPTSGTYTDYTFQIDPASIQDWDDNPHGFLQIFINKTDSSQAQLLVDSVSIS